MFQEFPYTNFHQLNLDWIVKIAKDFLDQYTHIQEVIQTGLEDLAESRETGLEELDQKRLDSLAELNQKTLDGLADLQEKYDTLDGLLQDWYDTHSADIAGQLADAITAFNTAAETKSQALLDSWPADYSELVTEYNNLKTSLNNSNKAINTILGIDLTWEEGLYALTTGEEQESSGWRRTNKFNYGVLPRLDFGTFQQTYGYNFYAYFWNNNTFLGSYDYWTETYYDATHTQTTTVEGYNIMAFASQTTVAYSYLNTIKIYSLDTLDVKIDNNYSALKSAGIKTGNADKFIIGDALSWETGMYNLYTGIATENNNWRRTPKINYNILPRLDFGIFLENYGLNFYVGFWWNDTFLGTYDYWTEKYYNPSYTEVAEITGYNTVAFFSQTTVANTYLNSIRIYSLDFVDEKYIAKTAPIPDIISIENGKLLTWESGLYSLTTGAATSNDAWYRTQKHQYALLPQITDTSLLFDYNLYACLWDNGVFVGTYSYADKKYRNTIFTIVNDPIPFDEWAIDINTAVQSSPKEALQNRTVPFNADGVFNAIYRNKRVRKRLGDPSKMFIGFIGDSLTYGITGPNSQRGISYPQWLSRYTGNAKFDYLAVPGASAMYILNNFLQLVDLSPYNMFIIMLGTNGYLEGDFETAKDDNTTQIWAYCEVIRLCLKSTNGQCKILLMNPPDSDDPNRTTAIKNHIHVNVEKIANYFGLPCLDIKQACNLSPSDATYYNQEDKVHLTDEGYRIIAETVYDYLIANYASMTSGTQYDMSWESE